MADVSPGQAYKMLEQYLSAKVVSGMQARSHLREVSMHPGEVNENLLFELLHNGEQTPFGKAHHFDQIKTVKDFKRLVPITTYDDYAAVDAQVMESGEDSLISSSPVVHFNQTSGTMGNPKGIPYTQLALENHNRYGEDYLFAMAFDKVGPVLTQGRCLSLTQVNLKTLPSGITYGAFSSKNMAGFADFLSLIISSPREAVFPVPNTDTRYLHARFALADATVTYVNTPFVTTLLELMRYVEDNWQMLVDDIEAGTIDPSVQLPGDVRARLESVLRPDPKRAAELRREFSKGFDRPIVPRVWHNMSLIIAIAGAGFSPYTERLRRYIGFDLPIYYYGYVASEGLFSVPIDLDDPRSVLLPEASYYEFLPLGEEHATETLGIEELEPGCDYEVILTNLSGFYRYKIRDAVRCVGSYYRCPMIEFLCRIDQTVSIRGEKTTEAVLRKVAEHVSSRCGFDMVDFSVFPNPDSRPARYEFLYEVFHPDTSMLNIDQIERVTDEELREGNPSVAAKESAGDLGLVKVSVLQEETNLLWRDLQVMKGTSPNQVKPVHIIDNPMKERFFLGLIDKDLSNAGRRGC